MRYLKKFYYINESLVRDNNFNALTDKQKGFLNDLDSIINEPDDAYEEDFGEMGLAEIRELAFDYMTRNDVSKADLDAILNANITLGNLSYYFNDIYGCVVDQEGRDNDRNNEITQIKRRIEDIINNNSTSVAANLIYDHLRKDCDRRGYLL